MSNSFATKDELRVGDRSYTFFNISKLTEKHPSLSRLPFSLKVLLENLLRHEDGRMVTRNDIEGLLGWDPTAKPSKEIAYHPARVLLQDFTGVPAVVDLAAMRDAMASLKGDPKRINPLQPVDLVIDHSVQIDQFGSDQALAFNTAREFERNQERYQFLRWGQGAFENFGAVPPGNGICHQVNLEYLGRVVFNKNGVAYPDTLVGTDSHTVMINGLGVLGWGVGGIEAEAAMLGQPVSMLIPQVVGFKLKGELPTGATATDLVLTVTQMLRAKGVVGKFVEYFGPGLSRLSLADRATLANMAPEYGATMGFFPVDAETVNYLRFTNRTKAHADLVDAYCKAQGLFRTPQSPEPVFSDTLELDLGTVVPSIAGPKRPQDRIPLSESKSTCAALLAETQEKTRGTNKGNNEHKKVAVNDQGQSFDLEDGAVVIAAITSCTNTSNPAVLVAAGLLAKKAVAKGLKVKPWVKTSLAPGSRVVTRYLQEANLLPSLEALGYHVVGYGCTTCIGNSGPIPLPIANAIQEGKLVVASVLSGNRNFEGRISPLVRMNFLASPPLVVAYALAGTMEIDFEKDPVGTDDDGKSVFLRDIWPSLDEVRPLMASSVKPEHFASEYAAVFEGDENWRALKVPSGEFYTWDDKSTYVRRPPFFENLPPEPAALQNIEQARVLALLGDSVTTDHISPAGAIPTESPAADYLRGHGVEPKDFNSFGSRRGNHEVMMRGTFGNIRLRNQLVPGVEGGFTKHMPSDERMTIYDAAMRYAEDKVPLVVLAGSEYGTGSSRDWAAKGTQLLGVRAVICRSFERIHRSNLIGMGVLPLQFMEGDGSDALGLSGQEKLSVRGIADGLEPGKHLQVTAQKEDGSTVDFQVLTRLDTPNEVDYFRHGGILVYVLRQLLKAS